MVPFPLQQLTYLGGCHSIVVGIIVTQKYAPHPQLPEASNVTASPGAWSPYIDIIAMPFQVRRNVLHHAKSALNGVSMQI